ncbi:hypothetical protein J2W30_003664 [Variovorax boronicumulans]|uniref:hypothetical protein n=1 Tax=Variovorax boronicumulans TaxID=436515 RepID=UPI002789E274|nr:hypothetical protein [Variovorax boronicumulans]MDQ0035891.1 hypothetical protein [Variovorax boronicumulans]
MDTTEIPQRWVTGNQPPHKAAGPAHDLSQDWIDAGRPHDFRSFRLGFESAVKKMATPAAVAGVALANGFADVVAELQKAHRIIYLQRMQMSTQGKALYARNAHHAGLIADDETRESERAAVLARAGVPL